MVALIDWYQATIPEYPRVVADALMTLPGALTLAHGKGRHGYTESASVHDRDGEQIACMLHGGPNQSPNVTGSGANAGPLAACIREHFPVHRVTRIDSAIDIHADFSVLHERCKAIATEFRLKAHGIIPLDAGDGSTFYIGSKASSTTFRNYEKGKQLRASAAEPETVPEDWCRLEVQHRPVRDARVAASLWTADQVWGVSPWTKRIAKELCGSDADRIIVQPRLLSTFERRCAAADRQFGALFAEIAAMEGGWEHVGPFLRDRVSRHASAL